MSDTQAPIDRIVVTGMRGDETWLDWVTAVLERAGYKVFRDDVGLDPGGDFNEDLGRLYSKATDIVFVVSENQPEFFRSGWSEKGPLLVVLTQPVEFSDPPFNMVELFGFEEKAAEEALARAAQTLGDPDVAGAAISLPLFPGKPMSDHDTLASRNDLSASYQAAGRIDDEAPDWPPGLVKLEDLGSTHFGLGVLVAERLVLTSARHFSVPFVAVIARNGGTSGGQARKLDAGDSGYGTDIALYEIFEPFTGVAPMTELAAAKRGQETEILGITEGGEPIAWSGTVTKSSADRIDIENFTGDVAPGAPITVEGALVGVAIEVNDNGILEAAPVAPAGTDEPDLLGIDGDIFDTGDGGSKSGDGVEDQVDAQVPEEESVGDGSGDVSETGDVGRTRLVHDQPATVDQLGRKALADEITALITELAAAESNRPEAFAIHLDAPWGAGKSTLVGFIAENLGEEDPPWLVVQLDAWRSSQLSPAWWALLSHVRDGVLSSKSGLPWAWFQLRQAAYGLKRLWRFLVPPIVALVALILIEILTPTTNIMASASAFSAVIALVVTFGAIGSRFLSLGTLQGARLHERLNDNPMEQVADRFRWLRERTDRPMLLVLDDVDRCNEAFAVELLDAMQTLMRSTNGSRPARRTRATTATTEEDVGETTPAPLVVLAVGDHRWLEAAYDHVYKVFAAHVGEPGRPLGRLFLDKLFQLHVDLPMLKSSQMNSYLTSLLTSSEAEAGQPTVHDTDTAERINVLKQQATAVVTQRTAERLSVDDGLAAVTSRAFDELPTSAAEEVVGYVLKERRKDPARSAREGHLLEDYGDLLDPNPRAAKRFVMAYNVNFAARAAEGAEIRGSELALWTLLSTRWPALADWVRDQLPDGSLAPVEETGHPSQLLYDPDVDRVIKSTKGGPLDRATVKRCCGYRSA